MNAKDLQEKMTHLKSYWHQLGLKNIVQTSVGESFCLTTTMTAGHIPDIELTALLHQGLNSHSLTIVVDASLPTAIVVNHATSCFLQQATAVLAPIALFINPDPLQLVIRQTRLISLKTKINSRAIIDSIQILAPLLHNACLQIHQQDLNTRDARTMADLLSEHWYEVIRHEE